MAEKSAQSVGLLRWCGIALVPAGVLIAVATLLHPSRETATTIIASEVGLIAAHAGRRSASLNDTRQRHPKYARRTGAVYHTERTKESTKPAAVLSATVGPPCS